MAQLWVAAHADIRGTSDQNDVIAAIRGYYTAVNDKDADKACSLLAPQVSNALIAASRKPTCEDAIDLTVEQQGHKKTQELADFRYDARDVKMSDDGQQATINTRDIMKINGHTTNIDSVIKLQKNSDGDWVLASLG